jgi:plasmid stabilization system protein ParE
MSSAGNDRSEQPRIYAVRTTERARRDLDAATIHFAETASPEIAAAWREEILDAFASLATLPRRCSLAPERFRGEVRHLVYRRPGSRTAYRVLFTITGEEVDSLEAPTVTIFHVRHASARPITRSEARRMEKEE